MGTELSAGAVVGTGVCPGGDVGVVVAPAVGVATPVGLESGLDVLVAAVPQAISKASKYKSKNSQWAVMLSPLGVECSLYDRLGVAPRGRV